MKFPPKKAIDKYLTGGVMPLCFIVLLSSFCVDSYPLSFELFIGGEIGIISIFLWILFGDIYYRY